MNEPHKWEFRPPPGGDVGEELVICPDKEMCRLGGMCPAAHSARELEEWKKRKQEQIRKQIQKGTYSDKILKEIFSESSSLPPMSTSLPGVKVVCDMKENLKFVTRNSSAVWSYHLSSHIFLKGISLLHVENLQHFTLSEVSRVRNGNILELPSNNRECTIGLEERDKNNSTYCYRLKLKFTTKVFGVFKQTILFDFGTKPLLSQTVNVCVSPESAEDDLLSVKESILSESEVWDESNSNILKFEPAPPKVQQDEDTLLSQYPIPQPSTINITKACGVTGLTLETYRQRFHELLYIEELSQYKEITGFNAHLNIHITERYLLSATPSNASTAKYARPGELFGRIELNSELSDDSKAGKLILTKCSSVLLRTDPDYSAEKKKGKKKTEKKKKVASANSKVWECLIEDTAKSVIYVRLPAALVLDLNLETDTRIKSEIQFKLSRLSLVEMHYAVDRLPDLRVVYPDISISLSIPWSPSHNWKETLDPLLNAKQKEAVLAITSPTAVHLPPILIIGPYGTGKTFTLGKAIDLLLKETTSRILVCTHSNSAADLYIKDYIDPAVTKGNLSKKILRIYYYNRWVQTVHTTVQKYCLIETDEMTSTRRFKIPTLQDLVDCDLVVATLSTSRCLTQLLKPGHFTHILLDEAAQALETEAILPLILANSMTRVVLAGDHMQLEPEVVSPIALEKHLNLSLLERLYDLYPRNYPCKILLCENYRSHQDIVSFTSNLFYDQKLVASGKQPLHPKWFPLTFFTARGEDVQDVNSTSYYNNYEVGEIVDRLIELKKNWPKVWGRKEEVEIGVVTPYHDQVMRIRAELRKKRMHNISVERVQNVQGKQYRAIFISTVRTRESCTSQPPERTDFGFLSSAKLLNTAVTRAQSLVAVVGDPVALCSVGRCRKLWENFLEICSKNKSLVGYTWKELRLNLEAIELKNIYGLNPMAKEFIPRVLSVSHESISAFPATLPPPVSCIPPWFSMTGFGTLPRVPGITTLGPYHGLSPLSLLGPGTPGFPLLNRPFYPGILPPSFSLPISAPLSSASYPHNPVLQSYRPPTMTVSTPTVRARFSPVSTPVQVKPEATANCKPQAVGGANKAGGVVTSAEDRILPPRTDLKTILLSRKAQITWFNSLKSVGKDIEAAAFQELIISEGGELLTEDGEHSAAVEVKDEVGQMKTLSLGRESPEDEEKDGMNSMFESLMADFDKDENEKFEYTPLYLRRAKPLDDSCDISSPRSSDSNLPSTHPNLEQPIHHGNRFNFHPQHASSEQSIQISGMNEMDSSSQNWHLQMELLRRKISFEELLGLENERVNSNLLQGNHGNHILENSLLFENQNLSENHCHPENQRFVDQSSFQENYFINQNERTSGTDSWNRFNPDPVDLETYPSFPDPERRVTSDSPSPLPTYARVVRTSPRQPEEDTLTKIRNLGTFGFQNLG